MKSVPGNFLRRHVGVQPTNFPKYLDKYLKANNAYLYSEEKHYSLKCKAKIMIKKLQYISRKRVNL